MWLFSLSVLCPRLILFIACSCSFTPLSPWFCPHPKWLSTSPIASICLNPMVNSLSTSYPTCQQCLTQAVTSTFLKHFLQMAFRTPNPLVLSHISRWSFWVCTVDSSSPWHPINVGKGPRPYPGLWFQITSRADDAHISLQGRPPGSMLSMSTVMANHHFQLLISHICLSWSPHSGRKMAIPLFHWNISLNSAWRICTAQAQNLSSLARLLSGKCPLSWVTPSAFVLQNCPSQKNKQNTPLSSPPDGVPISQLPL